MDVKMSITKTIAKRISNYNDLNSFGSRMRKRRSQLLLPMILEVFREKGKVEIIDVGGTRTYWNIIPVDLLRAQNVKITIVNFPDTEMSFDDPIFSFVAGDGRNLSNFDDNAFDIAHSNSVLEHVGNWEDMRRFAGEIARVGRKYFVQTPSFWFPIEPHCMVPFFHWLPTSIRIQLVLRFELGNWKKATNLSEAKRIVESAQLLTIKKMRAIFSDAIIHTEWLLFPKSHIAIRK
jgi:hypothetical protein